MDMTIIQYGKYVILNFAWIMYFICIALLGRLSIQIVENTLKINIMKNSVFKNIFLRILVYTGTGVSILGIISIPFYILNLSSSIFVVLVWGLMLMALAISLYQSARKYKNYPNTINVTIPKTTMQLIFAIAIAILLIFFVIDAAFSVWHGAFYADGSDLYVHYARIFDISEGIFSIKDGFLVGVDEVRYAINFLYTLFIPIVKPLEIIGVNPISIGFSGHLIFRIIQMLAAGALAVFVLKENLNLDKFKIGTLAILAIIATFCVTHFSAANYPNKLVLAWYVFLFIGGILVYRKKDYVAGIFLLVLGVILIAGTHPTYALMAAIYLIGCRVLVVVVDLIRKNKKELYNTKLNLLFIGAGVFLAIPSVLAYLSPNHMSAHALEIESGSYGMSLGGINIINPLPGIIGEANGGIATIVALMGLITLVVLLLRKWKNYNIQYFGMIFFVVFTVSNPLFMLIAEKAGVPYWLLLRFSSINIIALYQILFIFGVYSIIMIPKILSLKGRSKTIARGISFVLVAIILSSLLYNAKNTYSEAYQYGQKNNTAVSEVYRIMREEVEPVLPKDKEIVVLATSYVSYYMPQILPNASVISIDPLHMPPGADGQSREDCQTTLLEKVTDADSLRSAQIDYIVIDSWQPQEVFERQLKELRGDEGNFAELFKGSVYAVFKVNSGESRQSIESCTKFINTERGVE